MATKKTKATKKTEPTSPPVRAAKPKKAAARSPRQGTSARKSTTPAGGALPLEAQLRALDDSYAEGIAFPVGVILQEARELQGVLRKLAPRLLTGSRLDEALLASLPKRIEALDEADTRWTEHRVVQLPTERKKLRVQAEELRSDVIAALRHFVPQDAVLQARVAQIVEGTGIADLIEDLKKLSPLVVEQATALRRAKLPADVGARLLSLAQSLGQATTDAASERAGTDEARDALAMRNRAYWYLREALDEIRECGRHVFRKETDLARHFRSSYAHQHRSARAANPPTPAPPSPT